MSSTPYHGELRPYQQDAYRWLSERSRRILADDVGLGKTHTGARVLADGLPALVVAPTYLTQQWFDVLCEVMPHASVSMPEGARGRREFELEQYADIRVVNTEMLRTYTMPEVETVLIDEAHHLRNPKSGQGRNGRTLIWRTPRAYLLTATPYYKADEDVWHLLHCIEPSRFSSYWDFIREWFTVNWHAPYAPKIYGISKQKKPSYDKMISEYLLLRTYEHVGRQLPPLIEETITFTLPSLIQREYKALKSKWQLLGEPVESVGSVYYLLRQLTMCKDKVDAVMGIVDAVPREQVLIYTWYKESAHTLASKLRTADETPLLLTGDTPPDKRAELLAAQKRTKHPRLIVATMSALQEGVNMEHIRHVVYAEETYVKGTHLQTLARVRRDRGDAHQEGSEPPVVAYYVRAKGTVDEIIPAIRSARGNAGDHERARRLAAQS